MTRYLSDEELQDTRPPCPGHVWGMWRRAPSLLETDAQGITAVRHQRGKFHRNCKRCDRLQIGRGGAYGLDVVPGVIL
jgi:hypothetical protein